MNTALASFLRFPAGIRIATFTFGVMVPLAAFAELKNDSLLGPGVRSRPAYDGSASQVTEFVPALRYFGQPWFARTTLGVLEGGVRMELAPGLNAGAQLAYEPGRTPGESDFLQSHNVARIDRGASVGLHLEWDHKFGIVPISLLARARQNTDSDLGAQVDFRASAGVFEGERFSAGVYTQATWANAKSAGAFYGITPQQSVTTGLPVFSAGSGWLYASVGFIWSVELSRSWKVIGSMDARRLRGDAAQSPLTERTSNHYVSAGIAYYF
jgi:outer membrane protein